MKTIFDRDFRYVPSVKTDLHKTFARIRREQGSKNQLRDARPILDATENIVTLSVPKKSA
jgi:hypothetical protein